MRLEQIRWVRTQEVPKDNVLSFAARELARYVHDLTGHCLPVEAASQVGPLPGTVWLGICDQMPSPPQGTLQSTPWDDGYGVWQADEGLYVAGCNARSVLFGVYAFLELQGVRYLRPGDKGEVIPQIEDLCLPEAPIVQNAHYRHRGLCIEGAPSLDHALETVDWCAKKRLNTIFLQFLSSRYFYNLWYERPYNPQHAGKALDEAQALAYDDQVIAAMQERGLVLHRVGHGWTSAAFEMPRSGWVKAGEAVEPEYVRWLAEVNGERTLYHDIPINTELCYSHPPAFEAFVETILRYCEEHPELDVVHVWLSDATNNKCECEDCRKLTISDWYAKIINALSAALRERAPETRFVFLCYIELLWEPEQVAIEASSQENAIMMYAPIRRCYGHALDDPTCDDGEPWPRPELNQFNASAYNAFYTKRLAGWRKAFDGDSFDFDYHLMWAVWQQYTDTVQARILHADLQDLKRLGLDGLVSCQSFRAFYPSGLAMAVLSESLWDPSTSWKKMRQEYLAAAYGEHAAFAGAYLDEIERYLNTGDPHWRMPPLSNADETKLAACAAFLETSLVEIAKRQETVDDPARAFSLDLLVHHATWLQWVVHAYQARRAGDREGTNAEVDRAIAYLQETEDNYSTCIDTMLALRYLERAKR